MSMFSTPHLKVIARNASSGSQMRSVSKNGIEFLNSERNHFGMEFISLSDLCCSNKEKGKVKRQKAVKRKGSFTDFQEDLIKDLFERSAFSSIRFKSYVWQSSCMSLS